MSYGTDVYVAPNAVVCLSRNMISYISVICLLYICDKAHITPKAIVRV